MRRAPRGINGVHGDIIIGGKRFPVLIDLEENFMELSNGGTVSQHASVTAHGQVSHDVFEDLWRQVGERG